MKTRFFTFAFIFVSFFSFAQENLSFGIIGGLNFSNVVGADVIDNNTNRTGIHLGGYAEFPLENKFGLRGELHLISIKGTSSGNFRTIFIDIPLLASYKIADKFKLLAGLQPSILLSARVGDGRGNITNTIRTIDLGFIVGGWYDINNNWGVGARITPGLSRVGASGDERTFNFNFQLSVGYRFGKLGKSKDSEDTKEPE